LTIGRVAGNVEVGDAIAREQVAQLVTSRRSPLGQHDEFLRSALMVASPLIEEFAEGSMKHLVRRPPRLQQVIVDATARHAPADGFGGGRVTPTAERDQDGPLGPRMKV